MGKLDSLQQFFSAPNVEIGITGFILNLVLAIILALILGYLYVKYGRSLSNRRIFAKNFMMITMTTMLIITIVKSSLALSLGLVGALSIVRFRAAIKEPEELAYLFLSIAVGLGCGANQSKITLVGFIIIATVILLQKKSRQVMENKNLLLTVTSRGPTRLSLLQIVDTLKKHCRTVDLKRSDETEDITEASLLVETDSFELLNKAKTELQSLNKTVQITFLDNKGLA